LNFVDIYNLISSLSRSKVLAESPIFIDSITKEMSTRLKLSRCIMEEEEQYFVGK